MRRTQTFRVETIESWYRLSTTHGIESKSRPRLRWARLGGDRQAHLYTVARPLLVRLKAIGSFSVEPRKYRRRRIETLG
jgi:hypothetical protein